MRATALTCLICLGASSPAGAEVEREKILETVRAAFDAYQNLPCVGVKFEYKGEPPDLPTEESGAIVVYFAGEGLAWTRGEQAYEAHAETGNADNRITLARIGFNAERWSWTVTDSPNPDEIDLQSALVKLIPGALGYYVGPNPRQGGVDIVQGAVDRALGGLRELGARAVYFDDQANGCAESRPDDPADCDVLSSADAGVDEVADAGANDSQQVVCLYREPKGGLSFHWEAETVGYYVFIPEDGRLPGGSARYGTDGGVSTSDGGVVGDAGFVICTSHDQCAADEICSSQGICVAQSGGDGGCCRFTYTREQNLTYGILIALVLVVGLRRHRRRNRS